MAEWLLQTIMGIYCWFFIVKARATGAFIQGSELGEVLNKPPQSMIQ